VRFLRAIGTFAAVVVVSAAVTVGALIGTDSVLALGGAPSLQQVWPEVASERSTPEPPPRIVEFTVAAVGDLMTHGPQIDSAKTASGYDFNPCFAPVAPRISAADLAIGNLETTLSGADRGYSGYPQFNAPDAYAEALVAAGFDVLTTANNHNLDRGPTGLVRTLEVLDGLGALHTGTARTAEEAATTLVTEVKGVKIAILAYTYGMNGFTAPSDKPWMVNVLNVGKMTEAVKAARALEVDLVIVSIHNGVEYQRQPSASQRQVEEAMIEAGADIVLGSHPHVIQPMETIEVAEADGSTRTAFIIHSLGNFVSNQRERYRNTGLILEFGMEKNLRTDKTTLVSVEYVPVWVDDVDATGKEHRVLPIRDVLDDPAYPGVSADDRARMQQAWDDTTTHLGGTGEASDDPGALVFYGKPLARQ